MAQTELNRVYVQAVDATGASLNILSLGTKSLTSKVLIGGVGTSNIVTVEQYGITMAGPTTFTTGLSTAVLTATGNTTLINTSMANLGVTGNASIANASINILTVVGRSILQNVSTTNLGVTGNASLVSAGINTLSVVGQSTLFNVSTTALTVANNMNVGGNVSITGNVSMGTLLVSTLVSTNASINGTVNVAGATSLQGLTVAGAANFYNPVNVQGSQSLTVTGNTAITGTLGVTGQTNLGTTGTGALSVVGATTINTTGSATTTIGSATSATSVGGTLGVTGQTTLAATGTGALTVVGATIVNTTGSATTTIGSGTSATSVGGTLGVTGLFTAANSSITGNGTVGGTLGVTGQTTLQNASITGTLAVRGNCSLNGLMVAGATTINTTGSATTTIGSGSSATTVGGTLGVTGQTTLQNASITGTLAVTGNCSMNALTTTGVTTINVTGSATTTIGSGTSGTSVGGSLVVTGQTTLLNASITGTLAVTGNCSMNNVSTTALTVTGTFTAQDRINATSIWPQNYIDMSLAERLFVGGGLTLQYYMTEGFYKLWPTVSNPGYDAGGNYYQINILATSSVNNRDRFEKVFSLPAVGKKVKLEMTIASTGTDTTVSFYHPTTTLLYTTPVLTTTMTRYTFEFTVTSTARDYNIVMTPGKAYVLRLQVMSTNVYDGDFVGVGVSSWWRSATLNATTGQIVDTPVFETPLKSKIGNWFMYRQPDANGNCMGTVNDNSVNKFALYQDSAGALTVLNSAGSINFGILDVSKMTLTSAGNVGIGTQSPAYPLHIATFNDSTSVGPSAAWWNNQSGVFSTSYSTYQGARIGLYVARTILIGDSYISNSDRRIKDNIVDVDDDRALRDIRLMKPKTYTYKDTVTRGTKPVYGFIAQEVKEVLDYAVSTHKEVIPNIYELATFATDILTLTFNTTELARDASGNLFTKLKVKTREDKDEFVKILEVIDEHTLRVDKDLTEWGGHLDASGKVVPGNQIFVYGQEVDDFHHLTKDAIWTVATAALQEVDRQLQAEKQKVARLETALEILMARVLALEQKT